jgi:FtsZ-binding cell division protein ZapB
VGSKLAPFLQEIIPLLQMKMKELDPEKSTELDNELSEACMNTI